MAVTIKRTSESTYRLLASDGSDIREYNQTKMVYPVTGFRTSATLARQFRGRTSGSMSTDGKPENN